MVNSIRNLLLNSIALLVCLNLSCSALAQDAGDVKTVEIDGTNQLKFSVTEIMAKPGQKIHIKLTNTGKLPKLAMAHNFVLLKAAVDAAKVAQASAGYTDKDYIAPEMEDQIIAYTGLAGPGETVEITFIVPKKPGKYTYICTFPGHFFSGMKGTLIVK